MEFLSILQYGFMVCLMAGWKAEYISTSTTTSTEWLSLFKFSLEVDQHLGVNQHLRVTSKRWCLGVTLKLWLTPKCWSNSREKMLKCWKILFWPASSVQTPQFASQNTEHAVFLITFCIWKCVLPVCLGSRPPFLFWATFGSYSKFSAFCLIFLHFASKSCENSSIHWRYSYF